LTAAELLIIAFSLPVDFFLNFYTFFAVAASLEA